MIGSRQGAGLSEKDYMSGNLLGREVTADDVAQAFVHQALALKTTADVTTVDGGNIAAAMRCFHKKAMTPKAMAARPRSSNSHQFSAKAPRTAPPSGICPVWIFDIVCSPRLLILLFAWPSLAGCRDVSPARLFSGIFQCLGNLPADG
jgi:hypothetical protein